MGLWAATQPRPELDAARASAIERLRADIEAEAVTPAVKVQMLLDRTESQSRLTHLLEQQAQQIGGPRWLDDQTCQVRLDIPATAVRHELQQIASEHAQASPVSFQEMSADLRAWDARIFSATGTSTGAIESIRPPAGSTAWNDVPPAAVHQAVKAARQDAVDHVLDSIAPVPLAGGKQVGDALAIPEIGDAMANWIGTRPITLADFRDDRQVELTLALTPGELSGRLHDILVRRADVPHPFDDRGWNAIYEKIAKQMVKPIGKGSVAATTQADAIALPVVPPDWVDHQLDAQGSGADRGRLKAARVAELAADAKLREQINRLPIGSDKTLGDAAALSTKLNAAIDRTITRNARVYRIDYLSEDNATVRMSLDLNRLWEAIAEVR